MKGYIFFITVLVACHASVASSSELLKSLLNQIADRDCTTDGLYCKNCKEMQYCSSREALFTVNCSDQNSLKPYCDMEHNVCTSTETCVIPDSDFTCPHGGKGLYPDLLNCRKYHYCNGGGNSLGSTECPLGSFYDHKQEFCSQYLTCRTYSSTTGLCKGNINKFIPYAASPNLYVLCKADNPILLECPAKNLEFDASSLNCVFKCKAQGRFPHSDVHKFYSCVKINNSYVQQVSDCPENTIFPKEIADGTGKCKPNGDSPFVTENLTWKNLYSAF